MRQTAVATRFLFDREVKVGRPIFTSIWVARGDVAAAHFAKQQ
jgi:hypothetical protein